MTFPRDSRCCALLLPLLLCVVTLTVHATPVFEPIQVLPRYPWRPTARVIEGIDGNLYGTTTEGGGYGGGAAFKLTLDGTLTVLASFSFGGPDGTYPGPLIQAADGTFYGTTSGGGTMASGTVFKMTPAGTITTLASFAGIDGKYPRGSLTRASDGNFYGTTSEGGSANLGTVFRVTPAGALTTLTSFTGANGKNPTSALVEGSDGDFYGTTPEGGSANKGTVFRITSGGALTTLVSFTETNGQKPLASLVQASDGNFYGSAAYGGAFGKGTIFRMSPAGTLTTIVDFNQYGAYPQADLIQGDDGYLYGTTKSNVFKMTMAGAITILASYSESRAGLTQASDGNFYGTTEIGNGYDGGRVFKVDSDGNHSLLINFPASPVRNPSTPLVQGNDGHFYGTTGWTTESYGAAFKVTASGQFTPLQNFNPGGEGADPSGLVRASNGDFYGTSRTYGGYWNGTVFRMTPTGSLVGLAGFNGANGSNPGSEPIVSARFNPSVYLYGATTAGGLHNHGTVWGMNAGGTLTTLVHFNGSNGSNPAAKLLETGDFKLLGTTVAGGSNGFGTVFRISPLGGNALETLVSFNNANGKAPQGHLIKGSDGNYYGTTSEGGSAGHGTVYKLTPSGTLTPLVHFNSSNGANPRAGLVQSADGALYGTTVNGGSAGTGTVFRVTTAGALTTVVNFNGANGCYPQAALINATDGHLYGTTSGGGTSPDGQPIGAGQIFRIHMGPTVITQSAINLTSTGATLNGTVNAGGYLTATSFQYGTSPTLVTFTTVGSGSLGGTTTDAVVSADLSGLQPKTTHYFRAVAGNSENSVPQTGAILSFTTSPAKIDLVVEAPTGNPVASNSKLTFAATAVGLTAEESLTLRYTGTGSLGDISASISGIDASQFSLVTTPPATLPAGTPASFTVRFSPTSAGTKTGTLAINSNDPDESPFLIALAGSQLTTAEIWRDTYFGTSTNSGNAADSEDPDHDGLNNLLERAFNLHPLQGVGSPITPGVGTSGLPALHIAGGNRLGLVYLRRKSWTRPGLTYSPQFSPDLQTWSPATGAESVTSVDAEWERVTIDDTASGQRSRFGRLTISSAE